MIVRCIAWMRKYYSLVEKSFLAVLALLLVGDLWVPRHHVHFLGDEIPDFWALFGLGACALIIIGSKWLGHAWLFRPEDYYEREGNK